MKAAPPSFFDKLSIVLERILKDEVGGLSIPESIEIPKDDQFGDYSTNIFFRLAKQKKQNPKTLAAEYLPRIQSEFKAQGFVESLDDVKIEGPGFVNFFATKKEIHSVIDLIRSQGRDYGKPRLPKSKKMLIEYVSANPTGPLTVAHGRQAALGDSLVRILRFCGHDVTGEYYNNDEGVQITNLAESLSMRVEDRITGKTDREMPENYYRGEYLIEIAREFVAEFKPKLPFTPEIRAKLKIYARDKIMAGIMKDLADFGVAFDHTYSQEELGRSGRVEKSLEVLKKGGHVYESEGAVWLKSTAFGDDKDRVLKKSDGNYTYLTPDIAYHHHKFERGFEELVNIWGPDHHGYIARLKASQAALGHDPKQIHILIAQLVTLYDGGTQVRMSTRAGEFVTLREILDEVGRDAGRFFFLMRKFDAHLDFDLSLAKSQTPENPVFYIQYAHARVESIRGQLRDSGRKLPAADDAALSLLSSPHELRLMRLLGQFEDAVAGAERTLEPYRLVPYLMDLAGAFHRFYTEHRVIVDDDKLAATRMALADVTQVVIRSGLDLLGVSAPSKM